MQIIHAVLLEPVGCLAEFPAREFDEIAARLFHETSVHSSGSEAFWRVLDLLETSGQSLDPSQQKLAEELEVRAVDQVEIYEDVVPALSELKSMNIQMFLASSLSGAAVSRFLERFPRAAIFLRDLGSRKRRRRQSRTAGQSHANRVASAAARHRSGRYHARIGSGARPRRQLHPYDQ